MRVAPRHISDCQSNQHIYESTYYHQRDSCKSGTATTFECSINVTIKVECYHSNVIEWQSIPA